MTLTHRCLSIDRSKLAISAVVKEINENIKILFFLRSLFFDFME